MRSCYLCLCPCSCYQQLCHWRSQRNSNLVIIGPCIINLSYFTLHMRLKDFSVFLSISHHAKNMILVGQQNNFNRQTLQLPVKSPIFINTAIMHANMFISYVLLSLFLFILIIGIVLPFVGYVYIFNANRVENFT